MSNGPHHLHFKDEHGAYRFEWFRLEPHHVVATVEVNALIAEAKQKFKGVHLEEIEDLHDTCLQAAFRSSNEEKALRSLKALREFLRETPSVRRVYSQGNDHVVWLNHFGTRENKAIGALLNQAP